jgi:hypothetical protein
VSESYAYPGGKTGFKIFEKGEAPKEWDEQPIKLW